MENLWHVLSALPWGQVMLALALFVFGYLLSKKISHLLLRAVEKRYSKHQAMLLQRLVFYGMLVFFSISALQQLGFNLSVVLGAAGLFTVALGFASQTAASNLVSGIFLLFEQPFKVGDVIVYKGLKGSVEAIDWLSTKIKTSDNKRIRIPNEGLNKSEITNLSAYPQKSDELLLTISATHEVNKVKALLQEICSQNSAILTKPPVKIVVTQMVEGYGMELKLTYWSKQEIATVRDEVLTAIINAFKAEQIAFVEKVKNK